MQCLIDGHGCPTDSSIMSNIVQKEGDTIYLEAPFDAFKFPSSEIVVVSDQYDYYNNLEHSRVQK